MLTREVAERDLFTDMDFSAFLFICVALLLIVATILVVISTGIGRLESSIGIISDGIPIGRAAPSWNLSDLQGVFQRTPTHDKWQFLIFADRSLGGFLPVIAGMHALSVEDNLQVLQLSRDSQEFCAAMARGLDLQVPVVPVEDTFYDQFRVRVMPFGFLIDPTGVVRWRGLVSAEEQMRHVWHLIRELDREIEVVRG